MWLWLWLGIFLLPGGLRAIAQAGGRQLPNAPVPRGIRVAERAQGQQGRTMEGPPWMVQACTAGACSMQNRRAELCCGQSGENGFRDYVRSQTYHVYTWRQLAAMAVRDVADPFNLLSVLGSAAIVVGSNSHSIFGPGMPGLARATGVTLTENMTDEFFGTFLIPSIDHQAPGFRRMPNRGFWQRLAHCGTQVFWTRSQQGVPMVNYSSVVGTIAEQGVAVTYVPFRRTGWAAAAERVGLDYATAPIGNLINEFVPQVASHINVRVVFFQNIINRVATTVGQPPSP
ncbi:MAG: hypothetical protein ACP5M4_12900 [Acidobacteriaceae bacterium]